MSILPASAHEPSLFFQMGQFYYAAKAFDALEKLDPGSNYWEGKRGACVGIFQLILANKESKYVCLFFLCNNGGLDFIITRLTVFSYFFLLLLQNIRHSSPCHDQVKLNKIWTRISNFWGLLEWV